MNGELPSDQEIINTLDRARVLFHRFNQMTSQRVEAMTEGTISPDDLTLIHEINDMTEMIDASLIDARDTFAVLRDAIDAYRNQTEHVADAPEEASGQSNIDEDLPEPWLSPAKPPAYATTVKPVVKLDEPIPKQIKTIAVENNEANEIRTKIYYFFVDGNQARSFILGLFERSNAERSTLTRNNLIKRIARYLKIDVDLKRGYLKHFYEGLETLEQDFLVRDELPPRGDKEKGTIGYYLKTTPQTTES